MSTIDFYGIASDARGNIIQNKKVCISAIDDTTIIQITKTDDKGRFKFVTPSAGNYDIYRGVTINNPPEGKSKDINYLGTITVSFGSSVNDPAFTIEHFDADYGDCVLAGYHKSTHHFGGRLYLYNDKDDYTPTGSLSCVSGYWGLYTHIPEDTSDTEPLRIVWEGYGGTSNSFGMIFTDQYEADKNSRGDVPYIYGFSGGSSQPMFLGQTSGFAVPKKATHPYSAYTSSKAIDGNIHYKQTNRIAAIGSPVNTMNFLRVDGLENYGGGLTTFYLVIGSLGGGNYQADIYNIYPFGVLLATGTKFDSDGINVKVTMSAVGGSGVNGFVDFDYVGNDIVQYSYDATVENDYFMWDGYQWCRVLSEHNSNVYLTDNIHFYPDRDGHPTVNMGIEFTSTYAGNTIKLPVSDNFWLQTDYYIDIDSDSRIYIRSGDELHLQSDDGASGVTDYMKLYDDVTYGNVVNFKKDLLIDSGVGIIYL